MAGPVMNIGNFAWDTLPLGIEWFGDTYENYPTLYDKFYKVADSSERYQIAALMSGLSVAQYKPDSAAMASDYMKQAWNVKAEQAVYGLQFAVTREMLEDGHALDILEFGSKEMAKSCQVAQEILAINPMNAGFTTTLAGDGLSFFNTAHTITQARPGGATTYKNRPSTDSAPSEASLEQMTIDLMTSIIDERGVFKKAQPKILIVHPAQYPEVMRILRSPLRVDTGDNTINYLKYAGYFQTEVYQNPYITASSSWFVKTDANPDKGCILYVRRKPEFELKGEQDFDTENRRYKCSFRSVPMLIDPRDMYASAGA